MQAIHIGNYDNKRIYYVVDGVEGKDCILLSPNGVIKSTSFISFISKTSNIKILDDTKFRQFLWWGNEGKQAELWNNVFIKKTMPPPKEMVLGSAVVTEFPQRRQEQLKKMLNAAAEFKVLTQSGLGERLLGRHIDSVRNAGVRTSSKSLDKWFKEEWVDLSRPKPGGGFEPCGRPDADKGKYPKCVPASRAAKMTPDEIQSAIRRKRRAESTKKRVDKKPIYVPTVKSEKVNIPNDPELYARVKAEAKKKFRVYPSAYANAWLVREYKKRGGTYRTANKRQTQMQKLLDAALDFRMQLNLELEEKALGRRLGRTASSSIRRATGGIRGFVRGVDFDPDAEDADADGWVQEGTQFARRAVRRVSDEVDGAERTLRRGMASLAPRRWKVDDDPKFVQVMEAFSDEVPIEDMLQNLKTIRTTIDFMFNNNKPILTVGQAKKAFKKALTGGAKFRMDGFEGKPDDFPITENDIFAIYATLNAIRMRPSMARHDFQLTSFEKRNQNAQQSNSPLIDRGTRAAVSVDVAEKFQDGKPYVPAGRRFRINLDYWRDREATPRHYLALAEARLKGTRIKLEDIPKTPYDVSSKIATYMLSILDKDLNEIQKILGITLPRNREQAAEVLAEKMFALSEELGLHHEGFHMLHNAAILDDMQRKAGKWYFLEGGGKSRKQFLEGFADYLKSFYRKEISTKQKQQLFQASMLEGTSGGVALGLIRGIALQIFVFEEKAKRGREFLNAADQIEMNRQQNPTAYIRASTNVDLRRQLAQAFSNFFNRQPSDIFGTDIPSLDDILDAISQANMRPQVAQLENRLQDSLNALDRNKIKTLDGETMSITADMLAMLDSDILSASPYATWKALTGKSKQEGDPLTALEILSIFHAPHPALISVRQTQSGPRKTMHSWIDMLDATRAESPIDLMENVGVVDVGGLGIDVPYMNPSFIFGLFNDPSIKLSKRFGDRPIIKDKTTWQKVIYAAGLLAAGLQQAKKDGAFVTSVDWPSLKIPDASVDNFFSGGSLRVFNELSQEEEQLLEKLLKDVFSGKEVDLEDPATAELVEKFLFSDPLLHLVQKIRLPQSSDSGYVDFKIASSLFSSDDLSADERDILFSLISRMGGGKYRNYAMYKYPVTAGHILPHILGADIWEFIAELGAAHAAGSTLGYSGSRYVTMTFSDEEQAVVMKLFKWLAPEEKYPKMRFRKRGKSGTPRLGTV